MFLHRIKRKLSMKEIGDFTLGNGMRIYILDILFTCNSEAAWEFYMSNQEWQRMEFVDLKALFNHIKNQFIINM